MYLCEKKSAEVYARHYYNAQSIVKEDKGVQTHEGTSLDFILFNSLLEDLTKGQELRNNQKQVLILDFMKFKSEMAKKIKEFFYKQKAALVIKDKIEEYALKRTNFKINLVETPMASSVSKEVHKQIETVKPENKSASNFSTQTFEAYTAPVLEKKTEFLEKIESVTKKAASKGITHKLRSPTKATLKISKAVSRETSTNFNRINSPSKGIWQIFTTL